MNKVILTAVLRSDPELRFLPSGTAVCNLRLESKNIIKHGKEETLYITAITWGKTAEDCATNLKQGNRVWVEGRLQFRSWKNETGEKSVIELCVHTIQILKN